MRVFPGRTGEYFHFLGNVTLNVSVNHQKSQ